MAAVLPPVIPAADHPARPFTPAPGAERPPPPLPDLQATAAAPSRVYALTALDRNGRLADRSILRVLDWPAGRRLGIREQAGVITAGPAADGAGWVNVRGYLQIPLTIRRRCRLTAGGRVRRRPSPRPRKPISRSAPTIR